MSYSQEIGMSVPLFLQAYKNMNAEKPGEMDLNFLVFTNKENLQAIQENNTIL
jgi:hypothetical protein